MIFKAGFLVPLYNHGRTIKKVVASLVEFDLPVIIVDDGSDDETKQQLAETLTAFPLASSLCLKKNSGKGAALIAGFFYARDRGLSHVLQIDADAQHDVSRCRFFLEQAQKNPRAAICGRPEYNESVPPARLKGREVSRFWSRVCTLSNDIKDSLCGFRVYPVDASLRVIQNTWIDKRMAFDPEILVRFVWAGVPLVFFPVRVNYPADGISHFRMVADNVRISFSFSRLFFGMIIRLPLLVARKCKSRREDQT
ncbi:MAG: glycosyltransferase family 2 protein [Treponema sp.]|nr:glycosyltransferase family 2 protein [Treponema sp.]